MTARRSSSSTPIAASSWRRSGNRRALRLRHVNGLYTQRFNRRHERVGHVFQGRFHAVLVERETHFLELARYVVLNPVRAGIVRRAEDHRWSSLRANLGFEPTPRWLTPDEIVAPFGSAARFLEFVREGIGRASPWESHRAGVLARMPSPAASVHTSKTGRPSVRSRAPNASSGARAWTCSSRQE